MRAMAQILALYQEIDRGLESALKKALAEGDRAAADRIEQKQKVNDQAYFVLAWGQLETEIDDACRALIRRRRANASWDMRRGFDFYDPEGRRLSGLAFDRRLSLVLDRSGGPGRPWSKVIAYYETRNQIAHGRLQDDRLELSDTVADFYEVQGELAR